MSSLEVIRAQTRVARRITAFLARIPWTLAFLPRHELRIVAAMDKNHPVAFVILDDGPATPLGGIHLAVVIQRPFRRWKAINRQSMLLWT